MSELASVARPPARHYTVSAQKKGWGGIKNGALPALAEKEFNVFITGDRHAVQFNREATCLRGGFAMIGTPQREFSGEWSAALM